MAGTRPRVKTVPESAATWKTLVKALRIMGENVEAEIIEDNVSHTLLGLNVLRTVVVLKVRHSNLENK